MAMKTEGLDQGSVIAGLLMGLVLGAVVALFRVRRSGAETRQQLGEGLRGQLEEAITISDPVAESIAEGKAAARRRRAELGFDN